MLEVQDLAVNYRGISALNNINFHLASGQLTGVFGPNGAGKSTMVKAMLGLIPACRGRVKYEGRLLKEQLGRVAYVPQRSQIDWDYPITVWNAVMMARTVQTGWFRNPSRQSQELVKTALLRVGMWDLRDRQIGELSGGQQQRIFLARAIAQQADLFFFDEPFNAIDKATEEIVFDVFAELKAANKTLLVISHDLGENLKKYDNLLLLNKQLIAIGSCKEVLTVANIHKAYGYDLSLVSV
ncbi:MAG: metal ABC transporter ATP-binding protein [Oscillatoriales cyanobacterium]|uniref:metal ABC transporter ATP-binding protein n=1 Tax=Microcoleus anatoxicus TaxID=2705319 RepID=UPI002976D200|nr:MAG: metal ABC transporter ATP-binding protein [Oscillatoriales cyanobacterium]TAF31868.1 MAG: metal ABC transporter ATP-binding protein [Oscillatoriales cyanobacterium]